MKVILLHCGPLPNSFLVKLKIDYFLKKGFEFEYWNLSNIFFSKTELNDYYRGNKNFQSNLDNEKLFYTKKNLNEYLNRIKRNKKIIFWCYDLNNFDDFWIRRLFKLHNVNYFVGPKRTPFINLILEKNNFKRYSLDRIINAIKKRLIINFYTNLVKLYLFKNFNYYAQPLFVLGSGSLGKKIYKKIFPKSEFIEVPSFDLNWSISKFSHNDNFIVYVDDAIDLGGKKEYSQRRNSYYMCNDLDKFYRNLRIFFDKVEEIYKKKIIISASGKYIHKDNNKFGNREIFYNKTNELINKAFFIIGHESSGMWQAIASNKKIMIVDDYETSTPLRKKCIKKMAIFLNLSVYNLNKLNKKLIIEYFNSYDIDYGDLIYEYFSMNSSNKAFEKVLLEKLEFIENS